MARINVEQKALVDPRFYRLGLELGAAPEHAQAVGLFTMIRVWNECAERETYRLSGWVLQAICARSDGAEKIEIADLAEQYDDGSYRIRGTKGRTDYLREKRANARKNGKLGGRPRKPTSVSETGKTETQTNLRRFPQETPPAPAPAPAPAPEEEKKEEASASCSEPENPGSEPAVLTFPTVGKAQEWSLTQSHVDSLQETFPALSVLSEARKALEWVLANETHRKTPNGMKRFLFGWMTRAQNNGQATGNRNGEQRQQTKCRALTDEEMEHGTYNGYTGFAYDTKTCKRPTCQRPQCVAARNGQ